MAAIVLLVVGGAAAFFYYSQPIEQATPAPVAAAPAVVAATITVHVSGAVTAPGLAVIESEARVADAIAAVGGVISGADLTALNLAAPLRDGEQIVVPFASPHGGAPAVVDDGRVRINAASAAELETIPGVGPVLASRIIAARDEMGGFAAVEDLLDVSGIGEATLASMRDYVVIP